MRTPVRNEEEPVRYRSLATGRPDGGPLPPEDAPADSRDIADSGVLGVSGAGLRVWQETGVPWRIRRDDA